jgi:hypothetical protein
MNGNQQSDKEALQNLRLRLQKMSDEELLQYGRCAARLVAVKRVSATPNPQIIHLREARAEWKRRYPKAERRGETGA